MRWSSTGEGLRAGLHSSVAPVRAGVARRASMGGGAAPAAAKAGWRAGGVAGGVEDLDAVGEEGDGIGGEG